MADISQHRVTTNIHDALRVTGPDAVVFNAEAGVTDLLAYAQGQMQILSTLLLALEDADDADLSYALRSVLEPAKSAVELAVARLPAHVREGGAHV